ERDAARTGTGPLRGAVRHAVSRLRQYDGLLARGPPGVRRLGTPCRSSGAAGNGPGLPPDLSGFVSGLTELLADRTRTVTPMANREGGCNADSGRGQPPFRPPRPAGRQSSDLVSVPRNWALFSVFAIRLSSSSMPSLVPTAESMR